MRGCPPSIHGLFGLENTSKVVKSKVYIIHSRHFPFSCLSSLPDKGCETPSCPNLGVHSNSRVRCCPQIIPGISFIPQVCARGWPRRWAGLSQCSFLPLCWNFLSS